jgi:hypothetical protein
MTIVGLGLSEENCRRLVDGRPIPVRLRDLGVDVNIEIVLFGGRTEEDMQAELAKYVDLPEAHS